LINKIKTRDIIGLYRDYDVSKFFKNLSEISVLECKDTGYRFFYPFSTTGSGDFYEYLSGYENYYVPWKMEHSFALEHIKDGDNVLEIGCANGDFLNLARQHKKITAEGTELNEKAAEKAREKGLVVYGESLGELVNKRKGFYDVVCSFQVLEHISDVRSFMQNSLSLLKKNGKIIIGVPNNESFIQYTRDPFLNMPPHHMGLWNENSLGKMGNFFKLDTIGVYFESLPKYHYRYYYQVMFGDKLGFFGKTGIVKFIGKVINKALFECCGKFIIMSRAKKIIGHTIVIVFQKKI
jgi:SAM-dependent methyltransferase